MKRLDRSIGLWSVIAISLSAMLGSGIFVLPGLAVSKTGASVWLAYLCAGLCVAPAALCKAELGTAMPASGGTYVYLFRALGPFAGTVSGLGLWMSLLLKSSFALVGFSAYLKVLAPDVPIVPAGLALLVAVTILNVAGVGKLSKAQIVIASMSVVGLALLMLIGRNDYDPTNLEPLFREGGTGFVSATAFVFVSYAGVTKIAAIAEEIKDPSKNLPRGILLTLLIAMSLYGVVTFSIVSLVPHEQLAGDLRPVFTTAERVGGRNLGIAAAVLSVLTMTSMAAAGLLASSRFPFAMSRDNLLPSALRSVNERTKTPIVAILCTAAVMAIAIITLDVMKIAKLASAFTILMFMAVNLSLIVLRESRVAWYKPTYRAPLYPGVQIFGIVSGFVLLIALGPMPAVGALAIATFGTLIYFGYSRKRTEHLGVVGRIGNRGDLIQPSERSSSGPPPSHHSAAAVVVALFGNERSPEMLVDLAAALSDDRGIKAAHLTEVDEYDLDALDDEDMMVQSLRRRIRAMAEESHADVEFNAIMSRDLVRTVHSITSGAECRWLVMQWHGRPRRSLTSLSPIGWLINNLPTNLAMYKDAGVRHVRRILVLPAPGPHDALVVRTADYLAVRWNASVTLARFVDERRPESAVTAEVDYLSQLKRLCAAPTEERVLRGRNRATAVAEASAGFDLVVMSAPNLTLVNILFRSAEDKITAAAPCSVLTLRTPRAQTHEAYSRRPQSRPESRSRLVDYIGPDTVDARLPITQKNALMGHFAQRFSDVLAGVDKKAVQDAFLAREKEQNTGVGGGVGLPHGTVTAAERAIVGVFTTQEPIEYGAIDDEKVGVFFATLCPPSERETHLQLLSDIARLTLKTDVLEQLRAAESSQDIIDAIARCSEKLKP